MITNHGTKQAVNLRSIDSLVKVVSNKSTGQKSLHATTDFYPGDVICQFGAGTIQTHATYLTVQIGDDKHITLMPEILQYTNHSCAPNVFFDTTTMDLICLKAVKTGDELTFFYPSTEWEMAQPFVCHCGNNECLQVIDGAANLDVEVLEKYRLTDYISAKVKDRETVRP